KVVGGSYANRVAIREHHLEQTGIYTIVASSSWASHTTTTGGYALSLIKIPSTLPPGIYNPVPANGATITDLNQSFGCDAVAGATGYDLYFGEGVITPLNKLGENLTTLEMAFPEMTLNKVYYWHVEAHIPNSTIQGPYWWFKTKAIPIANFTYCPPQPVVTETIIFNASGSYDPDGGNITSYEWDFGDENSTNRAEPVINHSYTLVGDYIVNLTITDDEETRRSVSKTIAIMLRGDLNHDGQITSADALIALRIAANGAHNPAADVSDDNRVTSLDALMIMQAAEGAISL
ncbi:MAG: PKD domain-containing protein, partial [Euryarchaeota archaeon]|nr:PKD domain-containing protein [Euryarchaeota archaeon]